VNNVNAVVKRRKYDLPLLQILNARYPLLRIADHLTKQVGKACLAELLRPAAVQGAVVYRLAAGWVFQAGLGASLGLCGLACQWWLYGL